MGSFIIQFFLSYRLAIHSICVKRCHGQFGVVPTDSMRTGKIHFSSIFILLLVFILCGTAVAGDNTTNATQNNAASKAMDEHIHPVLYPITLFNKYISGADGNRCPMYPSCSQYSVEAFKKHGLFMGWIMTCDRLVRCGRDELKLSLPIWINGEKRSNDPLSNNDLLR